MDNNYKKGAGGRLQPYVSKGNGERSGQYTKMSFREEFIISERCTKLDLLMILSKEEIEAVKQYTIYEIGTTLNKAIRENRMSEDDAALKNKILSAISKHKLEEAVTVYRGITVSRDVYRENFLRNYLLDMPIIGSLICSTSRSKTRAYIAATTQNEEKIGIVFYGRLPRGYNALPIEGISNSPAEKEILISAPKYQIENIEGTIWKGCKIMLIKIKIMKGEEK